MRGIKLLTAVTLVSELGDISRFQTPPQLMAYAGLVPSEHSSGGAHPSRCRSPKAETPICVACWLKRLGIIDIGPRDTPTLRQRQRGGSFSSLQHSLERAATSAQALLPSDYARENQRPGGRGRRS